jgi:hypothetical protein
VSRLDPELAAALQDLEHALGPLQVLEVHPSPPERRPATPPAPAAGGPGQPSLFDPTPEPAPGPASTATSTTDPSGHLPPSRRWHEAPRHARPLSPSSATASTRRSL